MSAVDPLRAAQNRRRRLRAVQRPADDGSQPEVRSLPVLKCAYRPDDANFFCWKYGVWYNVLDCCYRHDLKTFAGCAGCGQGEGNLKTHRDLYRNSRHLGGPTRASR